MDFRYIFEIRRQLIHPPYSHPLLTLALDCYIHGFSLDQPLHTILNMPPIHSIRPNHHLRLNNGVVIVKYIDWDIFAVRLNM